MNFSFIIYIIYNDLRLMITSMEENTVGYQTFLITFFAFFIIVASIWLIRENFKEKESERADQRID